VENRAVWNAENRSVYQQQELESLNKQLQIIIKSIDDGICLINENRYITHVNSAYADIFGRSQEEMVGANIKDTSLEQVVTKVLATGEKVLEYIKGKSSEAPVAVEVSPVDVGEKIIGVIAIVRSNVVVQDLNETLKVAIQKSKFGPYWTTRTC